MLFYVNLITCEFTQCVAFSMICVNSCESCWWFAEKNVSLQAIIIKQDYYHKNINYITTIMKDFNYYAPTEVVFGEQSEEQVAALVKKYGGTKVLVHYGGQSAVKSGLLDKICGLLSDGGVAFVKLGGVVPNPRLSLAQKGIELCRQEGVDFN